MHSEDMIVLGSRKSDLALWQAVEVLRLLSCGDGAPGAQGMCIRTEVAQGDVALEQSLSSLAAGNPGLFTKELEVGLVSGAYDLAVHSLKDMPTTLPAGLVLGGISARDDPRDAVVLAARHAAAGLRGLDDLPPGSVIGTSSLRREAYLRRFYPQLKTALVRGNLNTRLRKLDAGGSGSGSGSAGEAAAAPGPAPSAAAAGGSSGGSSGGSAPPGDTAYDALLLAAAGLKRMGWAHRISSYPATEDCPYGVGQGALGIECRQDDPRALQLACNVTHPASALRCLCERAFLRALEGGCQVPIGVISSLLPSAPRARAPAAAAAAAAALHTGAAAAPGDIGAQDEAAAAGEAAAQPMPLAHTLVLRGTITSLDGSTSLTAEVSRAVLLPRGRTLQVVGTHGLDAVRGAVRSGGDTELRLCGGGGGGGGGEGSLRVGLGVTREEWEGMVACGEECGRACAEKLLGMRGGAAVVAQLGLGGRRELTYGALEAPADRA